MIWIIPFLLLCLFLLFRFVPSYEVLDLSPLPLVPSPPGAGNVEAFQALLVSPAFQDAYGAFFAFHQEFQTGWREALDTADSMTQEAGAVKKERTDEERNATVRSLTASQGKPFPLLVALPGKIETLEDMERSQLLVRVPPSAQPYLDALEWMNQSLLKAQKELDNVLQGGGIPNLEGFAGGACAEIAQCFKENPDLVRQVVAAQQEDAVARLERIQRELMGRFQQFQQPRLRSAFDLNVRLRANAKEVQRKAQSGDWVKDIKIRSKEPGETYSLPPGANALEEMRRKDPERYAQLQNSPLFSVKQLMEQINRNLR
jgi:hypothetical protein